MTRIESDQIDTKLLREIRKDYGDRLDYIYQAISEGANEKAWQKEIAKYKAIITMCENELTVTR